MSRASARPKAAKRSSSRSAAAASKGVGHTGQRDPASGVLLMPAEAGRVGTLRSSGDRGGAIAPSILLVFADGDRPVERGRARPGVATVARPAGTEFPQGPR